MIRKNPSDALDAIMTMIDDLHRVIVVEDASIEDITDAVDKAATKMERPRVIEGGRKD